MSKTGAAKRREILIKAKQDFCSGDYENDYTGKWQELYQRYWMQIKQRASFCEAWY